MLHFTVLPFDVRGNGVRTLIQDRQVVFKEDALNVMMKLYTHASWFVCIVMIAKEFIL